MEKSIAELRAELYELKRRNLEAEFANTSSKQREEVNMDAVGDRGKVAFLFAEAFKQKGYAFRNKSYEELMADCETRSLTRSISYTL